MRRSFYIYTLFAVFFVFSTAFAQGFKVKASGSQTFSFQDKGGRNQAAFYSETPLEDITGTANGVSGSVTFDVNSFAKTLKGEITVEVNSMNTGISLRDEHLKSPNWLDVAKYPAINFKIKEVTDFKSTGDNKAEFKIKGDFTMHGVTKEITAETEVTYLDESEQTKKRAAGDLLGIRAKFHVKLSDYGVKNSVIGNKVAEDIEVSVNIVGSNKM